MADPLFILATPRAYTSLLCGMIGQHPQTYGLPELNLFTIKEVRDFWEINTAKFGFTSNRRHGLLRTVAELYAGEQTTETIDMATHWCAARQQRNGGEVFKELVDKIHPLIAVDKSPTYTVDARFLNQTLETFPNAKFIHLIRHPISQGKSVMNLYDGAFAVVAHSIDFSNDKAVLDPQIAWHDINLNILELLERVPAENQIQLRGEDVIAQPERYFGQICRWLGIRDDAEAINEMLHPERSPYACVGPINAMYGNDPNFLRRATFQRHTPKLPSLDEPLPWRDDGIDLYPEVRALAREFNYS